MVCSTTVLDVDGETAVERHSAQAITAAIQSCLDECRQSDSPLAAVAETVERLRDEGWREIDVRRVEKVVLKVLFGVLLDEHLEEPSLDGLDEDVRG